jgi:hypothetical protein
MLVSLLNIAGFSTVLLPTFLLTVLLLLSPMMLLLSFLLLLAFLLLWAVSPPLLPSSLLLLIAGVTALSCFPAAVSVPAVAFVP